MCSIALRVGPSIRLNGKDVRKDVLLWNGL